MTHAEKLMLWCCLGFVATTHVLMLGRTLLGWWRARKERRICEVLTVHANHTLGLPKDTITVLPRKGPLS